VQGWNDSDRNKFKVSSTVLVDIVIIDPTPFVGGVRNMNERTSECFLASNYHRIGVGIALKRNADLSNAHL